MSRLENLVIEGDPSPAHEAAIKAALEIYLEEEGPARSRWAVRKDPQGESGEVPRGNRKSWNER